MRAHCVNAEHGALWLSEHHGDPGSGLKLDTSDFGGDVVHLGEYEVCLLRDACNAWLAEYAQTDRGRDGTQSAAPASEREPYPEASPSSGTPEEHVVVRAMADAAWEIYGEEFDPKDEDYLVARRILAALAEHQDEAKKAAE